LVSGLLISLPEVAVDSGLYAACAGLRARIDHLDLVGNNLANVNTTGYRAQQPAFSSLLAIRGDSPITELNVAVNDFGVLQESRIDLLPGNLERTGGQLDLAIEGTGFFSVQARSGVLYTRNGSFRTSTNGQLITSQGDPVLGEQGPITVPGGAVSISPDGTVSVGGAICGKLRLTEFSRGAQVKAVGTSYYSAPGDTIKPSPRSYVRQGMLETSNVNSVEASVSLIALQRHAEMLQRALSSFHNEFDRIAAADLPRL
jgi:flagellar basal-body rod protein FlgF